MQIHGTVGGWSVFRVLPFAQDSCASWDCPRSSDSRWQDLRRIPQSQQRCPCHSKPPGREELPLSLASCDTTRAQNREMCVAVASEGETNLCLANWHDKCELHALLEEGCQVSRTGRVRGRSIYFCVLEPVCVFQWTTAVWWDWGGIARLRGSVICLS